MSSDAAQDPLIKFAKLHKKFQEVHAQYKEAESNYHRILLTHDRYTRLCDESHTDMDRAQELMQILVDKLVVLETKMDAMSVRRV